MADVLLYSRPGCMFCAQVAALLRESGIQFHTLDVPERAAQDELVARYDARAFPLVLVNDEYIGGFTHVVRLHSQGRLRSIIRDEAREPRESRDPLSDSAVRARRTSSVDLTAEASASGPAAPARAGGGLADFAKLGEYLRRGKGR